MPENSLNCKLVIPPVEGLQEQQITVGRHFHFNCQGDWNKDFDLSKAQFLLSADQKYSLVLKKAEARSPYEMDIDVVSYVTGQWQYPNLILTDGSRQLQIDQLSFKVDSILPPNIPNQSGEQAAPPEPYGFQVAQMNWPVIYSISFLIFLIVLFLVILKSFIKAQVLRKKYSKIKNYDSAINPESQFYKSVRSLEKKKYEITELNKVVRLYVTRRYQIPALEMTTQETLRQFQRKWPRLKTEKNDLKNILYDLDKMLKDRKLDQDLNEYIPRIYRFVDHTEVKMQDDKL